MILRSTTAAFASPPAFTQTRENGFFVDMTPWEYPSVASRVHEEVGRRLRSDAPRAAVFRRVRDFVILQRLFRTILEGGFGDAFREERLVALAHTTASDVAIAPTPRWNWESARRVPRGD